MRPRYLTNDKTVPQLKQISVLFMGLMLQATISIFHTHDFSFGIFGNLSLSTLIIIFTLLVFYLMVKNAIRNTFFPAKNLINDIIYYDANQNLTGHLFYFCVFFRKFLSVLAIVLLKDIDHYVKMYIYMLIQFLWLIYAIRGDPFRTRATKYVAVINDSTYVMLILLMTHKIFFDQQSSFVICVSIIFSTTIGVLVVFTTKFILYVLSPECIHDIKEVLPFEIKKKEKKLDIDSDILPAKGWKKKVRMKQIKEAKQLKKSIQ